MSASTSIARNLQMFCARNLPTGVALLSKTSGELGVVFNSAWHEIKRGERERTPIGIVGGIYSRNLIKHLFRPVAVAVLDAYFETQEVATKGLTVKLSVPGFPLWHEIYSDYRRMRRVMPQIAEPRDRMADALLATPEEFATPWGMSNWLGKSVLPFVDVVSQYGWAAIEPERRRTATPGTFRDDVLFASLDMVLGTVADRAIQHYSQRTHDIDRAIRACNELFAQFSGAVQYGRKVKFMAVGGEMQWRIFKYNTHCCDKSYSTPNASCTPCPLDVSDNAAKRLAAVVDRGRGSVPYAQTFTGSNDDGSQAWTKSDVVARTQATVHAPGDALSLMGRTLLG